MNDFDTAASLMAHAEAEANSFETLYNTVHNSLMTNSLSDIRVKSMSEMEYLLERFKKEAKGLQEGEIHVTGPNDDPRDMSIRMDIIYKMSHASNRARVVLGHRDAVR